MTMESIIQSITNARITFALLSEFGISNASAQCIGYQEAVDMVTLGEVYKSSQLVIVSLRVCSGPQQTRSFYRVSDRAEISTRSVPYLSWFAFSVPSLSPFLLSLHSFSL